MGSAFESFGKGKDIADGIEFGGVFVRGGEAPSRQEGRERREGPQAGAAEARGVDGRRYVWGNGLDVNLTLTKMNKRAQEKHPFLAPPGSFKFTDTSVYNVYDMAGNVREMTSSPLPGSSTLYQIKGGSAFTPATFLPCCYASDTPVVPSDVGFRYVQKIPSSP